MERLKKRGRNVAFHLSGQEFIDFQTAARKSGSTSTKQFIMLMLTYWNRKDKEAEKNGETEGEAAE